MPGMGPGPAPDNLQTLDKWLAIAAVVQILNVHYFKSRLVEQVFGIEVRIAGHAGSRHHARPRGMRIKTAFGISVDIKLNLANAFIQLNIQRRMRIAEFIS